MKILLLNKINSMKQIFLYIAVALFISCENKKNAETTSPETDSNLAQTLPDEPLNYPALYTDWEIDNKENLNTVLSVYKDWDEVSVNRLTDFFADSVVLDMPDGRRTAGSKEEVVAKMEKFRSGYTSTHNQVLHAIPLINKATQIHWVRVMVYNKWTYTDNKRDSMLYYDLWRFKGNKIDYLLSLGQTPSRLEVKQLEKMAGDLKK